MPEKKFNFSTRDPGHLRKAQFFLKIDFLVQHMGTSPQVKMASRYGLRPWLWLLVQRMFRMGFGETPNRCRIIRLGKSNLCWSRTN